VTFGGPRPPYTARAELCQRKQQLTELSDVKKEIIVLKRQGKLFKTHWKNGIVGQDIKDNTD
jgi:hypothetical protein